MRIASVSKAFSGATALALVDQGILSLDDTIGARLPDLPTQWHGVTLRQLLAHTSGLPDFTASPAFANAVTASPASPPAPRDLLAFVEDQPLGFPSGSAYNYSNSDNIAVALMVEAATGARYEQALGAKVLGPLELRRTRMPRGTLLPDPFIHGYAPGAPGAPDDVTQLIAFGGWAWASGGIVSTPGNLNRFVRGYVGGRLFGKRVRSDQLRLIESSNSEPRGPGQNAAGLGIFRYRTRCGTVFGHTGSILGYTQLIAAKRSGRRSLTFTITSQVSDEILPELRKAQVRAVCAALARR
jgi:D-alanyl-D-alanine carboxypeptidase